MIERSTNMLFMRKLTKGKSAKELAHIIIYVISPFKKCIKSITADNGTGSTFPSQQLLNTSVISK